MSLFKDCCNGLYFKQGNETTQIYYLSILGAWYRISSSGTGSGHCQSGLPAEAMWGVSVLCLSILEAAAVLDYCYFSPVSLSVFPLCPTLIFVLTLSVPLLGPLELWAH
jgi:hypothetical protein